jgi:hypothetical protein
VLRAIFFATFAVKIFLRKSPENPQGSNESSPKVPVETPTPPALPKKRLGKETLADAFVRMRALFLEALSN